MGECPVLAVAISEFDIDKGNTLTSFWPQRFDWSKFEETNIADLCLPDGGHLHTEDWTYLFLHTKMASPPGSTGVPGPNPSSKRATKKLEPPRTIGTNSTSPTAGGTSNSSTPSLSLSAAAVAELGARTRADSVSRNSGLSPRGMVSPRKLGASTDHVVVDPAHGDHHSAEGPVSPHSPSPTGSGSNVAASNTDLVYGIAMFHNKADKTVRRGAIQKSLLLISRVPLFDVYRDILRHVVVHFIETGDKSVLKVLFEALKSNWGAKEVTVFGKTFPYVGSAAASTTMKPDEFGSASLKELVQRFGVDTMYLWYTMLLRQRILFSGQPAHLVGECCLACPLLVAPLQGFARHISPYVALTDITPLEREHYICGTTNSILETHTGRYDMMASFSTGIVRKSNAKLSTMDKEFILNVISGMSAKGEKWVRDQFFNYTKKFLDSVASNTYKSAQHKALGEPFRLSELYEHYMTSLKQAGPGGAANSNQTTESLDSITTTLQQASSGTTTLSDAKTKQLLWDLLQRLVDLNTIDELCEKNILAVIAPMLDSNSAQVRKYAVATLAQVAISIKGQISLIQHHLIPRVVLMLRDPMPNVASAAAYCLYKISSLFIGVTALVQHRVPKMLLNIICSSEDNLTLKISTAETLLQIHRLDPTLPIVGHDNIKMLIRSTSDVTFRNVLVLLLDLWGEPRLPIKTNEEIEFHLSSLRAGGLDVRTGSTSMLLSSVAQDRNLLLQIVAAGGIQVIVKNLVQTPREEPLARLSMAILCLACDTSMGRLSLIGYNAIPIVIAEFQATDFALHLFYVGRFLEVACQYPATTEVFLEANGLNAIVDAILKYAENPSLRTLTMPCLGALKYLALLNPLLLHKHPELVKSFMPVAQTYRTIIRGTYEAITGTKGMKHSASTSSLPTSDADQGSPFEVVLRSVANDAKEKDFYQLMQTVVSLWHPESLEKVLISPASARSSPNGKNGASQLIEVPIIDDELRSTSEKFVNLLSTHQATRSSNRKASRGKLFQKNATGAGVDILAESESEDSLSRRASVILEADGEDEDIMAAADSILADLESAGGKSRSPHKPTSVPSLDLSKKNTATSGAKAISESELEKAIAELVDDEKSLDEGVDQLLADLASETIKSARSRSTTATEIDILAEAEMLLQGENNVKGATHSLPPPSPKSESRTPHTSSTPTSTSAPALLSPKQASNDAAQSPKSPSSAASTGSTSSANVPAPVISKSVVEYSAAAVAAPHADSPRTYASSLGGSLLTVGSPGVSSSSPSKRPKFVPELNVGDMWDDIADLTTSILAEVPSEPSTPSSAHGSGSGRGSRSSTGVLSNEGQALSSPPRRSSEGHADIPVGAAISLE